MVEIKLRNEVNSKTLRPTPRPPVLIYKKKLTPACKHLNV